MHNSMAKKILRHTFIISVLLHILFLLSITTVILVQPTLEEQEHKKPPQLYMPSYVYKGAIKPAKNSHKMKQTQPTLEQDVAENKTPATKTKPSRATEIKQVNQQDDGTILSSKQTQKSIEHAKRQIYPKSILAASLAMLQQNQIESLNEAVNNSEEPILLIGDENSVADPIIKLLGRSLSAHFKYPETEGRLGIHGRVLVELTLHPQGYYTNIHLVKSSDNEALDAAALYAANTAPQVLGADRFLQKPKRFLVGFVFE